MPRCPGTSMRWSTPRGTSPDASTSSASASGLGERPGTNDVEAALLSPTLGSCATAIPKIEDWAAGDGLTRSYDYWRYWNGVSTIYRPSLLALGVAGVRVAVGVVVALLVFAAYRSTRSFAGPAGGVAFVTPIVATTDLVDLPAATYQGLGVAAALGSYVAMLRLAGVDRSLWGIATSAFVLGAAYLFFVDLTNPASAWTSVTFAAGLAAVASDRLAAVAGRMLASAVGWIAGFAWMWFGKWLLTGFVLGFGSVRTQITDQIEFRIEGDTVGFTNRPVDVWQRVWNEWYAQPLTPTLLLVAGVAIVLVSLWRRDGREIWERRVLLCLAAGLPVVWYTMMRNHTFLHAWFVYRDLAFAAGVLGCALIGRFVVATTVEECGNASTKPDRASSRPVVYGTEHQRREVVQHDE